MYCYHHYVVVVGSSVVVVIIIIILRNILVLLLYDYCYYCYLLSPLKSITIKVVLPRFRFLTYSLQQDW